MCVEGENRDYATLCICAIRYCFGRKTYMPGLVQNIVLKNIDRISDDDLNIILRDLEGMSEFDYGDQIIDKPHWLNFYDELKLEHNRRSSENAHGYEKKSCC